MDTDYSQQRIVVACDLDVEEAHRRVHKYVKTIRQLGLHKVDLSSIEKINDFVLQFSPAGEYFPGGLMGHDREGNVISVQPIARSMPKLQMRCESNSRLMQIAIAISEGLHRVVRAEERKRGRRLGLRVICDLEGLNLDLLYKPSITLGLQAVALLQYIFPDRMIRSVYVINAPATIRYFYALIQKVISKHTKEITEFLTGDWRRRLCDEFGHENTFAHWGGTKMAPNQLSTGWIRTGGRPPESLLYDPETSIHEVPEYELSSLCVPARGHRIVQVNVDEVPCMLKWFWRVEKGDVDFGIRRDEDGKELWPKFRLSTEFVPEYGSLECRRTGMYSFWFDNGHSRLSSKTIIYKIYSVSSSSSSDSSSSVDE